MSVKSGIRKMKSGFLPVMQAAVPSVNAAEAPEVIIAASQPISSATRRPAASCNSSILTKRVEAAAIAATTSGRISEAVNTV